MHTPQHLPAGTHRITAVVAVVAEEEARAISARTKAALAAAKARGTRLGNPDGACGPRPLPRPARQPMRR